MQFFIAVSALFTVSAAYLLYQFLSSAFASDVSAGDVASETDAAADRAA